MTGQGAGKGDRYRPVDQKKYDEGWEAAFGDKSKKKKKKHVVKRQKGKNK
tara:strand:- start:607 stop:756 length:150 start_codon:yes stop_codon:yes gene_type:complete